MAEASDRSSLAALLAWYRAMGADAAVGEEAVDWLERGEAGPGAGFRLVDSAGEVAPGEAPSGWPPGRATGPLPAGPRAGSGAVPVPPAATRPGFAPQAPDAAVMAARSAARAAKTLSELQQALLLFEGCGLRATAKNLCFFRGAEQARCLIIGEAPGREEDLEGKPFVGRAGQLLDRMLKAAGLEDSQVHITNIVYWRPPGNRTPTPQEAQVCRPFLERQVELVDPEVVVLLGGAAAKHVLDLSEGIMKVRGVWREAELGQKKYRAMATLHPAFLLRTPASKRQAWRDFLEISEFLSGSRGGR